MVRSQDIARIVGVSRQAVSAVLNGHGSSSVSAEKCARIKAVATSPYEKLAECCARRVCGLLTEGPDTSSVCESISSHLIIRESTAAFRGKERK